jgi:hypothetical protein
MKILAERLMAMRYTSLICEPPSCFCGDFLADLRSVSAVLCLGEEGLKMRLLRWIFDCPFDLFPVTADSDAGMILLFDEGGECTPFTNLVVEFMYALLDRLRALCSTDATVFCMFVIVITY